MNWAIARSSRARRFLSTTKRAPDILLAAAKSISPVASPRSTWSLGWKAKLRWLPVRRISTLPVSSMPSGTSSNGRLGSTSSAAVSSASSSAASASPFFSPSSRDATSAISASAFSPLRLAMPICWLSALRLAWRVSLSVMAARRRASIARIPAESGARLRLFRPASKAAGFSRMKRMSCMALAAGRVGFLGLLLLYLAFPLDPAADQDADLVEGEQRDRERELADHVGRRQHGCGNEADHDGIAALGLQPGGGDDANPHQQGEQHRHLEGEAEGEDELQDAPQIVRGAQRLLDVGRRVARQHEVDHVRQHDVVHDRAAGIEHERRGGQERQEGALLLLVEAGRHEEPDLRRDQREAHDQRHEARQLHRDEEELEDVEHHHPVALIERRLHQEREDRLGEIEGDEEHREEAQQRIDQPLAQLDQVIEQRHRLVVFRSVVRLGQLQVFAAGGALCRPLGRNSKRELAYSAAAWAGFSAGLSPAGAGSAGLASAVSTGPGAGSMLSGVDSAAICGCGSAAIWGADSGSASGLSNVLLASASAFSPSAMPSWMVSRICLVGSSDFRSTPPVASVSCFLTSSSSDWRTISSTWPRNSEAMPRICAIHLPQVLSRPGSSFGPMTTSATIAMTSSSGLSMPNMDAPLSGPFGP